MKTYHYETSTALQAALQRRATRANSPKLPYGAAISIQAGDMWAAVFNGRASHLIRIGTDNAPDNDGRCVLQLVTTPDSTCYVIMRGPSAYTLDAVSAAYVRRYIKPVR